MIPSFPPISLLLVHLLFQSPIGHRLQHLWALMDLQLEPDFDLECRWRLPRPHWLYLSSSSFSSFYLFSLPKQLRLALPPSLMLHPEHGLQFLLLLAYHFALSFLESLLLFQRIPSSEVEKEHVSTSSWTSSSFQLLVWLDLLKVNL